MSRLKILLILISVTVQLSGCVTVVFESSDETPADESMEAQEESNSGMDEAPQDTSSDDRTTPSLALTTASGTSSDQWNVRVTAATENVPVSEYRAILSTSSGSYTDSLSNWNEGGYSITRATGATSLSVGERLSISGPFSGMVQLELLHTPTGTSSGSISRAF